MSRGLSARVSRSGSSAPTSTIARPDSYHRQSRTSPPENASRQPRMPPETVRVLSMDSTGRQPERLARRQGSPSRGTAARRLWVRSGSIDPIRDDDDLRCVVAFANGPLLDGDSVHENAVSKPTRPALRQP